MLIVFSWWSVSHCFLFIHLCVLSFKLVYECCACPVEVFSLQYVLSMSALHFCSCQCLCFRGYCPPSLSYSSSPSESSAPPPCITFHLLWSPFFTSSGIGLFLLVSQVVALMISEHQLCYPWSFSPSLLHLTIIWPECLRVSTESDSYASELYLLVISDQYFIIENKLSQHKWVRVSFFLMHSDHS